MQARQRHADVKPGGDVVGLEFQRAPERGERVLVPLIVEQRAAQQQQRLEIVRVLLEHLGQPGDGLARLAGAAQQVGQRHGGVVERRQRVERLLVGLARVVPLLFLLAQAANFEPHLHEAAVELERRAYAVSAPCGRPLECDIALQFVEIGAGRRALLRHPQCGERFRRGAGDGARPRHGDQHLDVVGGDGDELFREPAGFVALAQRQERFHFAEARVGARGVHGPRFAETLQRFAVQAAARVDIAQDHARFGAVCAALHARVASAAASSIRPLLT